MREAAARWVDDNVKPEWAEEQHRTGDYHTWDLHRRLADDGWLSIAVHHALNLVALGQFDTIYHEHFQYYTVLSAMRALATSVSRPIWLCHQPLHAIAPSQ